MQITQQEHKTHKSKEKVPNLLDAYYTLKIVQSNLYAIFLRVSLAVFVLVSKTKYIVAPHLKNQLCT